MKRWLRAGQWLCFLLFLVLGEYAAGKALLSTDLVERLLSPTDDPTLLLPLCYLMYRVLVIVTVPGLAAATLLGLVWPKQSAASEGAP